MPLPAPACPFTAALGLQRWGSSCCSGLVDGAQRPHFTVWPFTGSVCGTLRHTGNCSRLLKGNTMCLVGYVSSHTQQIPVSRASCSQISLKNVRTQVMDHFATRDNPRCAPESRAATALRTIPAGGSCFTTGGRAAGGQAHPSSEQTGPRRCRRNGRRRPPGDRFHTHISQ